MTNESINREALVAKLKLWSEQDQKSRIYKAGEWEMDMINQLPPLIK